MVRALGTYDITAIRASMKRSTYNMGQYLLRHAFERDGILPDSILWRQKAAFSDAVGRSMADDLEEYAGRSNSHGTLA